MLLKKISIVMMVLFVVALPAMNRPPIKSTRTAIVSDPYSIFRAAERGNITVIRKMIADRVDLNQVDKVFGNTPLIIAAMNGKTDVMEALIEAGAKLDIKNTADENAMFAAVRTGQVESVRTLLKAGMSPNQREDLGLGGGQTLLMIATQNNNPEIVKLLVEEGADTRAQLPGMEHLQRRTAGQMVERSPNQDEIKAYTQYKKEKLP